MKFKFMKARYSGKCGGCSQPIEIGMAIHYGGQRGTFHDGCQPGAGASDPDGGQLSEGEQADAAEREMGRRERERDNAQYEAGIADARRYQENRKMLGDEMAERLEIEEELRRGDDY